jgi:hypothetical protein
MGLAGMIGGQPPGDIHVHLPGTLEAWKYKTVLLSDHPR